MPSEPIKSLLNKETQHRRGVFMKMTARAVHILYTQHSSVNRYINIIQIACVVYTFQNRNYIRIFAEIPDSEIWVFLFVTKDGLQPPNKNIQIANLLCCKYHLFLTLIAGFQMPILVKVISVSDLHLNRFGCLI